MRTADMSCMIVMNVARVICWWLYVYSSAFAGNRARKLLCEGLTGRQQSYNLLDHNPLYSPRKPVPV
jgi:hypothetical protein